MHDNAPPTGVDGALEPVVGSPVVGSVAQGLLGLISRLD